MNKAYLEITMKVTDANRPMAGAVYAKYREPFLDTIQGAESKNLLVRAEDVQVIHSFTSRGNAEKYLTSKLFGNDIVNELRPLLSADPDIRIYEMQ